MKVIFVKDIPGIARKNDIKNVKPGYYHNYLLPRGMAVLATEKLIAATEAKRAAEGLRLEELARNAAEIAKKIEGAKLILKHKVTSKGKLYAAVTEKEILEVIKSELKIELAKDNLKMKPIKKVGEAEIEIHLPGDVKAKLTVMIEAQ